MAEGLQEAVQAFHQEVNPEASRPRDESGRFASVASRPESMFEPRPVEGDEVTGDTRDGGEDARLAAIEKRVADGRAEEGDNEALQQSAEKPAAEEGDAGDEAKPAAEADDEAAENWQVMLNGKPVEQLEVTVDGRPTAVTLDECVKGYIREQTFHQRLNQVQTARQQIEQEAANTAQWRDHYGQKLQLLDRELGELTPQEPNWDEEFKANPAQAREKQKAFQAIYQKRQFLAQEMDRTAQEARAEYDRNAQQYAVREFGKFVQEANIPDENALNARMGRMRAYGKQVGFSEGELATVYDSRMLLVLDAASKYHELMANKPKAVAPGKGKALVPGVATPIGNATRRHIDDAQNRLAKTGRLEDAALVMSRLIR